MDNKIKLAFFDIDGTIVGPSGTVGIRDLRAMSDLKKKGIKLAVASGRGLSSALSIMENCEFDGLSSVFAGAVVYDPVTKEVIRASYISEQRKRMTELWSALREGSFYREVHTLDGIYITEPHPYADLHAQYLHTYPMVSGESIIDDRDDLIKMEIIVDGEQEQLRLNSVLKQFPEFCYGSASGAKHPGVIFTNITGQNSSREETFRFILDKENLTSDEVISFGDSESDRSFIELAGLGVAMANAPCSVKEISNFVTLSVEEAGVAHALEELGILSNSN